MNREHFLEGLREQYSEEIQEAYLECCHEGGTVTDFGALSTRLLKLQKNAKVEGLSEPEFKDLVSSTLDTEVCAKVTWTPGKKAA